MSRQAKLSSLLLPLPLLLQSDPSLECSPRFGRELVCVRRAGELKLSQSVAEDEEAVRQLPIQSVILLRVVQVVLEVWVMVFMVLMLLVLLEPLAKLQ